jgi:hypothetical protein
MRVKWSQLVPFVEMQALLLADDSFHALHLARWSNCMLHSMNRFVIGCTMDALCLNGYLTVGVPGTVVPRAAVRPDAGHVCERPARLGCLYPVINVLGKRDTTFARFIVSISLADG